MTKRTLAQKKKAPEAEPAVLAPGLHAGTIELRSGDAFRVRLLGGPVVAATLDDAVEPGLAQECQRRGLRVIVTDSARGPIILGALQTAVPVAREADGAVTIAGKKIHIKADQGVVLESGEASLRLQRDGAFKLEGDKMVVDVAGLVRFLSARVEFP